MRPREIVVPESSARWAERFKIAHPGLGVLFEVEPAAHVEHQRRRDHHDARFDEVVVLALEEKLEHHRGAEAREDGEAGADSRATAPFPGTRPG